MLASANTNFTDICTIKSPCVPLKCSIEGIWFADIKHKRKLLKEAKKFRAALLSVDVQRLMGEVEMDEVMLVEEGPVEMDDELNGLHLHLPMDMYTIEDKEVELPMDEGEEETEQEEEVNYLTTDPAQLLKTLSPMLGTKGEIRDISEVPAMTKLMKDAEKLVTKCVYSNILRATSDAAVLEAFVSAGGWDILNDWLQEAKMEVNDAFLRELLKVYSQIPITVTLLKQNACAKTIKQLSKSDTAGLKTLATEIVDQWMSTVRQDSGSSDKSKKRKHSHKEKDRSEKDKKSSSKDTSKDSSSKSSPEHKTKSRISPERDAAPASPPTSTKTEPSKPRPKTVKAVPTKFRSTGLEQETILPPTKMKGAMDKDIKSLPLKRPSLSIPKPSPPEKKLRPSLPSPLPSATPIDKKGGVKFIAPRPKPVQVYESAGFMDALAPTLTVAGMRRKRKGSASGKPTTPTSPPGTKQPSVPSFYQDTLESAEDEKESSASPDNPEGDDKENAEGGETENVAEGEMTTAEPAMPRKKRKKVSWAEEGNLKSFFYFELDETERVNVNKQKDFAASMKDDMRMEREQFGSHKRPVGTPDGLIGGVMWRRPRLIAGLRDVTDNGCNSTEKKTQKEREQVMLQALYFSKSMIPDSAAEPDTEAYEPVDPKTIPLEDETGGVCETVFTEYPKPVEVVDIPISAPPPSRSQGLSLHPDIAKMVASMAQQSQINDRAAVTQDYSSTQHGQAQQQYPGVPAAHNGAYNTQQFSQQGNSMSVPPPPTAVQHNMMNMAAPPPGYPPNYAPPGYADTSGPPPPYGHPPPPDNRPPPYGPPPPRMQGMHPRDEEWGENMHGGPMMGPGPRGPPPGMPPRGYGGMRRGPPGPPRGRGPPGPPGPPRVCQHFMKGMCKFEKNCRHLHPGINGPRL